MIDWFKTERQKYRIPIRRAHQQAFPALQSFDARSQELYGTGLPRGVLVPRLDKDRERINFWMSPSELLRHRYVPGQILIGKFAGQLLGHMDDRPMVTIAKSRSGKTSTIIEPNLYLYPGSMLVLDPKGGLRTSPLIEDHWATKSLCLIPSVSRESRARPSTHSPNSILMTKLSSMM